MAGVNFVPIAPIVKHVAGHVSQQAPSHFFGGLWHFVSCPSAIYVALLADALARFGKVQLAPLLFLALPVRDVEEGRCMVRGRILTPQIDSRSLMSEELLMLAVIEQAFSDLVSGCPAVRADAEAYFLAYAADSSAFSLDAVCAQFHLSTSAIRGEVRRRLKQRPLGKGKPLRQAA
jgi:hypothetical protein